MTISRHSHYLDVAGVQLEPIDITLSFDEERVPYAQLTATCALGSGAELLDSTQNQRVSVRMRQDFMSSEKVADISADYVGRVVADIAAAQNFINTNPGFEDGVVGWEPDPDTIEPPGSDPGTITASTTHVRTGVGAAMLQAATGEVSAYVRTVDRFDVQAGVPFLVSGWFFTENPFPGETAAVAAVIFYDSLGNEISPGAVIDAQIVNPLEWTRVGGVAYAPANAVTGRPVMIGVAPPGQPIWMDDVTLSVERIGLRSVSAQYGRPYNGFGIRESTVVRADLGLRLVHIDHEAGTVVIEASSDEALLQDYALVDTGPVTPGTATVRGCVDMVLGRVLNDAVWTPDTGSQPVETDALPWSPGETGWGYLQSIVGMAGLRLWCDEDGLWHLDDPETYIPPGQVNVSPGSLGTLAEINDRSGEWADAAVVAYSWANSSGVAQTRYDISNPGGTKSVAYEIERPYPGAGLARAIARRLKARRKTIEAGGVSDYSVRPYRAAQVELPDGTTLSGIVGSVTWSQPADRMELGTRNLISIGPNAWLATPSGVSWNDIDAGVSWEEYQWTG